MKKEYDETFIEIFEIAHYDVITTSGNNNGDNEVDAGGEW